MPNHPEESTLTFTEPFRTARPQFRTINIESPRSSFFTSVRDEDDDDDCDEDDEYCDCGCMDEPESTMFFGSQDDEEDYMPNTVSQAFRMSVDTSSIVPHPFVVGTDKVGVEIELENIRYEMPRSEFWKDKDDGSLRNSGHEYVFRQPFGGRDLLTALQEVDSYLHDKNADGSWRCSTHVHLDVRDMTAQQVKYLLIAYTIYERLIFRCSGWHRYKNNFCPAFGFAQGQIMTLSKCWNFTGTNFLRQVVQNWAKYSSLNLLPMRTQGSVEFRMSEAKRHKGQLLRLCNRLLTLKQLAKNWQGSEEELIHHLMNIPPLEVFGHKSLPKGYQGDPVDQVLGAKLAIDIIHHQKLRNKELLAAGETVIQLGNIRQWDDIARFARENGFTMDGVDLSEGSSNPPTFTFNQLRMLSRHTLLSYHWFIQDRSMLEDFENFNSTCNEVGM